MRFRVTVRGDKTELRGYVDSEVWGVAGTDLDFADLMKPFGLVIASEAADDYDPFSAPEDASIRIITDLMKDNEVDNLPDLIRIMAQIHMMQANVIQGERARADSAEAELRDRELHHFEVEQENAQLKADHTESEKALIDRVNEQADEIERLTLQLQGEEHG